MNLPGAVSTARLPERVRALVTQLNLHYAGAALLLVLNLWLGVALFLAWRTTSSSGADALAQQRTNLRLAQLQAQPLEGLDTKLITSNTEADTFYQRRLPTSYSQVLSELGALTRRENVKLTRVGYAQAPVLQDTSAALTEVRMDAALTGEYRSLVLFINSLERDRMFFLITAVTLTGQQSGVVGLRLRFNTWLRPGGLGEEVASGPLPAVDDQLGSSSASAAAEQSSASSGTPAAAPPALAQAPSSRPAALLQQPASVSPVQRQQRSREDSNSQFTPPPGGPPEIHTSNPPFQGGSSR